MMDVDGEVEKLQDPGCRTVNDVQGECVRIDGKVIVD